MAIINDELITRIAAAMNVNTPNGWNMLKEKEKENANPNNVTIVLKLLIIMLFLALLTASFSSGIT